MVSAGHFASDKLSSRGFSRVQLSGFADTPAVLTQVQTYQGQDFVVTRTRRQTAQSFEVTMQEEERLNRGEHSRETIGWIAVSQNVAGSEDVLVASSTPRRVNHNASVIQIPPTSEMPNILVKLSSYHGRDTANVRVISQSSGSFTAQVMEERSRDRERNHVVETLSYLAFNGEFGLLIESTDDRPEEPVSRAFGEYGQVTLGQEWQTVGLQHQYDNPVVVVSDPSAQEGVAITVRLREVGPQSFEARLVSADPAAQLLPSTLSFMVMESGEWITESGARMIAGRRESSRLSRQGWESISFDALNRSAVAFTQVQTNHESGWLTTRVRRQNARSFQVTMQEPEVSNRGQHTEEQIGWIVIEQGAHDLGDAQVLSMTSPRVFTHNPVRISFTEGFESRPTLLSKLASSYGGDSANISVTEAGPNGFTAIVAEEQSRDQEVRHTREKLSFLALSSPSGCFMTP